MVFLNSDIIFQISASLSLLEMPSVTNEENTFLLENEATRKLDQIQPAITIIITAKNSKDRIRTTLR